MAKRIAVAAIMLIAVSAAAAQQGSVRVTVARANVRQTPSDRGTIVAQVPYGTVLDLAGVDGEWFRVFVPIGALRVEAFLSRKVAALVTPAGGATPPGSPAAPAAAPTAAPAKPAPGISVAADAAGKTIWLTASPVRAVPVMERASTLAALARSGALETAAAGRATLPGDPSAAINWVWLLDRDQPAAVLADNRPSFFAAYRDAPGVNIDDLIPAVVRLVPAGERWAIVAMLSGRADAATRSDVEWTIARDLRQDAVKVELDGAAMGTVSVRLAAPLAPGDYALVLRPASLKKYPGRDVLSDEGIGSVLSVAWAFKIRR